MANNSKDDLNNESLVKIKQERKLSKYIKISKKVRNALSIGLLFVGTIFLGVKEFTLGVILCLIAAAFLTLNIKQIILWIDNIVD